MLYTAPTALLRTLEGHAGFVCSVAVADGTIVSGSWDVTVRVWRLSDGALLRTLEGHAYAVQSVAVACALNTSCGCEIRGRTRGRGAAKAHQDFARAKALATYHRAEATNYGTKAAAATSCAISVLTVLTDRTSTRGRRGQTG